MAAKPKQYVETMEEAYAYVQREWESSGWTLLGARGFCAVHVQSVRAEITSRLANFHECSCWLSSGLQWGNASALGIHDATCLLGGEHQLFSNSEVWAVCNC